LEHVDTELEEFLSWADTFVELADEVDFDDITGEGTEISRGVVVVDLNALELTLDLTGVDVVVSYFLRNEVTSPHSHTVVVNSDELVVSVVEELDLVSNVHADGVAAHSLTSLNLPDDEVVVVLTSEGSQVLLVLREAE